MLDMSILTYPKEDVCVRVRSAEDARYFLDEMRRQYPEKCRAWGDGYTYWDRCEERGYIDYFPYLNNKEQAEFGLCWDDSDYAEREGCEIVEFHDIPDMIKVDLGEIPASDFTIDNLFS